MNESSIPKQLHTILPRMDLQKKEGSVEIRVSRFLSRYRTTPQTSTGVSPAELLLGRTPRSRLDLAYPEMGRKVCLQVCSEKEAS